MIIMEKLIYILHNNYSLKLSDFYKKYYSILINA